jgi:hypothetical protein
LSGHGGYMIRLPKNEIMDNYKFGPQCFASMSNSPYNLIHSVSGKVANSNAECVIHGGRVYLKATKKIYPGQEILWCYGNGFKYKKFIRSNTTTILAASSTSYV